MHELSVTKNVLQLVIRYAEANKVNRVVGVQLETGNARHCRRSNAEMLPVFGKVRLLRELY